MIIGASPSQRVRNNLLDALGIYRYKHIDFNKTFDYNQAALLEQIGGVDISTQEKDRLVNVNISGQQQEIGLDELILSEFEIYRHYLRGVNSNSTQGQLRNICYSTEQQLIRQDPLYYALYTALRPNKYQRLVSYPYYAKYNVKGDSTYFRYININIPNLLAIGRGENIIQGSVSIDNKGEEDYTVILARIYKEQLRQQ